VRLVSDFSDCTDAWFDADGPEFRRVSTEGPGKRSQFALLCAAGFRVPPHGPVKDVTNTWWAEECCWPQLVVAYEDEQAHCGKGKRLLRPEHYKWDGCVTRIRECDRLNSLFCSAYLGKVPRIPSVSWRLLQVGYHRFWVEYTSRTDWRSNCGDGNCQVIGVERDAGPHPALPYPLWAVDFVLGKEMYAVDLNVAPGIRGSGVERVVSPRELAASIRAAAEDLSSCRRCR
jgi:hypothetical protein